MRLHHGQSPAEATADTHADRHVRLYLRAAAHLLGVPSDDLDAWVADCIRTATRLATPRPAAS